MTDRPNTPGYNRHLDIKISPTKNGKLRATYYCRGNFRWLPIKMVDAELFIAQGLATQYIKAE